MVYHRIYIYRVERKSPPVSQVYIDIYTLTPGCADAKGNTMDVIPSNQSVKCKHSAISLVTFGARNFR